MKLTYYYINECCISDEDDFQGEYTYIASKKQLVVNRVEETRKYDCEIEGDKMSISIEGHSIGTFKRVE